MKPSVLDTVVAWGFILWAIVDGLMNPYIFKTVPMSIIFASLGAGYLVGRNYKRSLTKKPKND